MKTRVLTALSVLVIVIGMGFTVTQQEKDYSLARVQRTTGKYVFTYCEPVQPYDVAFIVEVKLVWSNSQINSVSKIQNLILDKAFKISKETGKDFDAIIIGSGAKDLAIKFKE